MDTPHERFASLAVGHVLGGLPAEDADDFRAHLSGCRPCRQRVAELRGIASDLASAEREERAAERLRTTVARDVAREEDGPAAASDGITLTNRHLGVTALVLLLVVAGLGFWNLHLRGQVAATLGSIERAETTLDTFVDGRAVAAELADGVRGTVVTDGERVAFSLTGLPDRAPGEQIVAWRLGTEDGDVPVLLAARDGGQLAGAVTLDGGDGVSLTLEPVAAGLPDTPGGTELLRTDLAAED